MDEKQQPAAAAHKANKPSYLNSPNILKPRSNDFTENWNRLAMMAGVTSFTSSTRERVYSCWLVSTNCNRVPLNSSHSSNVHPMNSSLTSSRCVSVWKYCRTLVVARCLNRSLRMLPASVFSVSRKQLAFDLMETCSSCSHTLRNSKGMLTFFAGCLIFNESFHLLRVAKHSRLASKH